MFEILKFNCEYEIEKEYPHRIREIWRNKIITEFESFGYIYVNINFKPVLKHLLIAQQFIENDDPDNKTHVEHINRNKLDNSIENLRWCTHSEHDKNSHKPKYYSIRPHVYFNELPNDAEFLEGHGFTRDRFYYDRLNECVLMKTESGLFKPMKAYKHGNLFRIGPYVLMLKDKI